MRDEYVAQSWERDDEFWTEGWVRWWFDEAKQKMFDLPGRLTRHMRALRTVRSCFG